MKVPVLLGVDGEAKALFVDKGRCGIYFEPENREELRQAVLLLEKDAQLCMELGERGRDFVNGHFNRTNIARQFYEQLKKL